MKKLITLLTIAVLTTNLHATSALKTVTDERMELLSIVARLADFQEYNMHKEENNNEFVEIFFVRHYDEKVETHFSNFKTHPVVKRAQQMRAEHTLQYDGVFMFATHLVIENDSIFINPELITKNADNRCFNKLTPQFIVELNDFYKQSNAKQFFDANRELYNQFDDCYNENVAKHLQLQWFSDFFGYSHGGFNLITTFLAGTCNYGASTVDKQGVKNAFSTVSAKFDKQNQPIAHKTSIFTLVHEFAHSYCNPAIRKYVDTLDPYAEIIYSRMGENIKKHPYNAREAVLYEGFVRTIEIMYAKSINYNYSNQLSRDKKLGFYWLEDFAEKLEEYENNRDKYKNINDFMPEIVQFYIDLASKES